MQKLALDHAQLNRHLILTGTATKAEYQKVLRTVEYENASDAPNTTDREVDFTANDGDADSTAPTSTVSIMPTILPRST